MVGGGVDEWVEDGRARFFAWLGVKEERCDESNATETHDDGMNAGMATIANKIEVLAV